MADTAPLASPPSSDQEDPDKDPKNTSLAPEVTEDEETVEEGTESAGAEVTRPPIKKYSEWLVNDKSPIEAFEGLNQKEAEVVADLSSKKRYLDYRRNELLERGEYNGRETETKLIADFNEAIKSSTITLGEGGEFGDEKVNAAAEAASVFADVDSAGNRLRLISNLDDTTIQRMDVLSGEGEDAIEYRAKAKAYLDYLGRESKDSDEVQEFYQESINELLDSTDTDALNVASVYSDKIPFAKKVGDDGEVEYFASPLAIENAGGIGPAIAQSIKNGFLSPEDAVQVYRYGEKDEETGLTLAERSRAQEINSIIPDAVGSMADDDVISNAMLTYASELPKAYEVLAKADAEGESSLTESEKFALESFQKERDDYYEALASTINTSETAPVGFKVNPEDKSFRLLADQYVDQYSQANDEKTFITEGDDFSGNIKKNPLTGDKYIHQAALYRPDIFEKSMADAKLTDEEQSALRKQRDIFLDVVRVAGLDLMTTEDGQSWEEYLEERGGRQEIYDNYRDELWEKRNEKISSGELTVDQAASYYPDTEAPSYGSVVSDFLEKAKPDESFIYGLGFLEEYAFSPIHYVTSIPLLAGKLPMVGDAIKESGVYEAAEEESMFLVRENINKMESLRKLGYVPDWKYDLTVGAGGLLGQISTDYVLTLGAGSGARLGGAAIGKKAGLTGAKKSALAKVTKQLADKVNLTKVFKAKGAAKRKAFKEAISEAKGKFPGKKLSDVRGVLFRSALATYSRNHAAAMVQVQDNPNTAGLDRDTQREIAEDIADLRTGIEVGLTSVFSFMGADAVESIVLKGASSRQVKRSIARLAGKDRITNKQFANIVGRGMREVEKELGLRRNGLTKLIAGGVSEAVEEGAPETAGVIFEDFMLNYLDYNDKAQDEPMLDTWGKFLKFNQYVAEGNIDSELALRALKSGGYEGAIAGILGSSVSGARTVAGMAVPSRSRETVEAARAAQRALAEKLSDRLSENGAPVTAEVIRNFLKTPARGQTFGGLTRAEVEQKLAEGSLTPQEAAALEAELTPAPTPAAEPAAEPAPEAAAEPAAGPTPEAVTEPAPEAATEPAPEAAAEPTPEATEPPTPTPVSETDDAPAVTPEARVEEDLTDSEADEIIRGAQDAAFEGEDPTILNTPKVAPDPKLDPTTADHETDKAAAGTTSANLIPKQLDEAKTDKGKKQSATVADEIRNARAEGARVVFVDDLNEADATLKKARGGKGISEDTKKKYKNADSFNTVVDGTPVTFIFESKTQKKTAGALRGIAKRAARHAAIVKAAGRDPVVLPSEATSKKAARKKTRYNSMSDTEKVLTIIELLDGPDGIQLDSKEDAAFIKYVRELAGKLQDSNTIEGEMLAASIMDKGFKPILPPASERSTPNLESRIRNGRPVRRFNKQKIEDIANTLGNRKESFLRFVSALERALASVPADIPVRLITGKDTGYARANGGVIEINLGEWFGLYNTSIDIDLAVRSDFKKATAHMDRVIDEEVRHIASFRSIPQALFDKVVDGMSDADFQYILDTYYGFDPVARKKVENILKTGTPAQIKQQKDNLVEEFLRQAGQERTGGFTTEEAMNLLQGKGEQQRSFRQMVMEYLKGLYRRITNKTKMGRILSGPERAALARIQNELSFMQSDYADPMPYGYRSSADPTGPEADMAALEQVAGAPEMTPKRWILEDGFIFTEQPDGTLTDGDMTFDSIEQLTEAMGPPRLMGPNETRGDMGFGGDGSPEGWNEFMEGDPGPRFDELEDDSDWWKKEDGDQDWDDDANDIILNAPAIFQEYNYTEEQMRDALPSNKRSKLGEARDLEPGTIVTARLDIPSVKRGVFNQTIHKGTIGPVLGYDKAVRLTDVTMAVREKEASKIKGGANKSPMAAVKGGFVPGVEVPEDIETWTPVRFNPHVHSFFFTEEGETPVISADEAFVIGARVYVKGNIQTGDRNDYLYAPRISNLDAREDADYMDAIDRGDYDMAEEVINKMAERYGVEDPELIFRDNDGNIMTPSQRFMTPPSVLTPEKIARHKELEAKYNAGTLTPEEEQEARNIVEEAAKAAGYDIKVWHGTGSDFDIFKERPGSLYGPQFFFSDSKHNSEGYASNSGRSFWRIVHNPKMTPEQLEAEDYDDNTIESGFYSKEEAEEYAEAEVGASYALEFVPRASQLKKVNLRLRNPLRVDAKGKNFDSIEFDEPGFREWLRGPDALWGEEVPRASVERIGKFAQENGYDGVIVRNVIDSVGNQDEAPKFTDNFFGGGYGDLHHQEPQTTLVVFNPNQIKSADPFTGVPIDERFDPSSDSILYTPRYMTGVEGAEDVNTDVEIDIRGLLETLEVPQYHTNKLDLGNAVKRAVITGRISDERVRNMIISINRFQKVIPGYMKAYEERMKTAIKRLNKGKDGPLDEDLRADFNTAIGTEDIIVSDEKRTEIQEILDEDLETIRQDSDRFREPKEDELKKIEESIAAKNPDVTPEELAVLVGIEFKNKLFKEARDKATQSKVNLFKEAAEAKKVEVAAALARLEKSAPELAQLVIDVRQAITDISQFAMESGIPMSDELRMVFDATQGFYLSRKYRFFNDPAYRSALLEEAAVGAKPGDFQKKIEEALPLFEELLRSQTHKKLFEKEARKQLSEGNITVSQLRDDPEIRKNIKKAVESQIDQEIGDVDKASRAALLDYLESYGDRREQQYTEHGVRIVDSILKNKENIPEPIRNLLGQYKSEEDMLDGFRVMLQTVGNQTAMLASAMKLQNLKTINDEIPDVKNKFILTDEQYIAGRENGSIKPGEFSEWDKKTGSMSKADPLKGMYVQTELADALLAKDNKFNYDTATQTERGLHVVGGVVGFLTGMSMMAVTGFSGAAYYLRNSIGNLFRAINSGQFTDPRFLGSFLVRSMAEGVAAVPFVSPKVRYVPDKIARLLNGESVSLESLMSEHYKLQSLSVVDQSVTAASLRDIFNPSKQNPTEFYAKLEQIDQSSRVGRLTRKSVSNFFEYIQKLQNSTDNAYKLSTYYRHKRLLEKAREEGSGSFRGVDISSMSDYAIEREAALMMNKITPGEDYLIQAGEYITQSWLRYILGPFTRFRSEVVRTYTNMWREPYRLLASQNPVLKGEGGRRVVGLLALHTISFGPATFLLSKLLGGFDQEEQDVLDEANPSFFSLAQLIRTRSGDVVTDINFTYMNEMALLGDTFSYAMQKMRGGESAMEAALGSAVVFAGREVLGEQILTGTLQDLRDNTDSYTQRNIYRSTDDAFEKLEKSMQYIFKRVRPATIRGITEAMDAYEVADGEKESKMDAATKAFLGRAVFPTKPFSDTLQNKLNNTLRKYSNDKRDILNDKSRLAQEFKSGVEVRRPTQAKLDELADGLVKDMTRIFDDVDMVVRGYQKMQVSEEDITKALNESFNMSETEIDYYLRTGNFVLPYFSKGQEKKLNAFEDQDDAKARVEAFKKALREYSTPDTGNIRIYTPRKTNK